MLEACGYAAEPALGAVIGTDGLFDEPVLVWADLDEPLVRTFSRSHARGLAAAQRAGALRLRARLPAGDRRRSPSSRPGTRSSIRRRWSRPIVNPECGRCPWWEHCLPQLHPDDVSLRIDKGALDSREIVTLRRRGITTITDLVGCRPRRAAGVVSAGGDPPQRRRDAAADRGPARPDAAGGHLVRPGDRPARSRCPAAEIEIDFDIESAFDGRIYLWGFLVDGVYQEFSRFDDLDDASETALAVEAFRWLRSVVDSGERVVVYHYSGYEVARIRALADREHDPLLDWAAGYAEEHFVDLLEIVKAHYFGVAGLGLKLMAKHAGFRWRDDDPGGLNSQLWFAEAVHAAEPGSRAAAQQRVLEYNEDDVIATSQVRAWLRAQ